MKFLLLTFVDFFISIDFVRTTNFEIQTIINVQVTSSFQSNTITFNFVRNIESNCYTYIYILCFENLFKRTNKGNCKLDCKLKHYLKYFTCILLKMLKGILFSPGNYNYGYTRNIKQICSL